MNSTVSSDFALIMDIKYRAGEDFMVSSLITVQVALAERTV